MPQMYNIMAVNMKKKKHFELTHGAYVGNLGSNRAHISQSCLSLMNLINKITFL